MRRAFILCILISAGAFADDLTDSRRLAREAAAAYKAKDYATVLEKARAAADLRPSHPALLYNVAAALALNGRSDEALDVLEHVAEMGIVSEPAKDDDLASLRSSPRFARLVEAFERNGAATATTSRAFSIDDRGIISEGITYDAVTGRFFVSSVRRGVIYARDRRGRISEFARDAQRGIFGMTVDVKRRKLWAAAASLPHDRAAVLEIDLDSGTILRTIVAPDNGPHLFGDIAISRDGRAFVSDSASPTIYVVSGNAIEPFIQDGPFGSLQGLAISTDGRLLYASDYARGIFAIDLVTRDLRLLPVPPAVTLLGIDGLCAPAKRALIATQNGINPQRVIRIALAPDGLSVRGVEILASNERDFDDITLGVSVGKAFYFNAASQWALFDQEGKVPDPGRLKPARVLRLSMPSAPPGSSQRSE